METKKRVTLLDAIDATQTEATDDATVWLDGATWAQARKLREQIRDAKKAEGESLASKVPGLVAELDQLAADLKESELVFTFRQLPKTESSALVDAHPPTDDTMAWNGDTYPPALVQAACIGVRGVYEADGISVEEVAGLWERLAQSQTDELFATAFKLQLEAPRPFTWAATGTIRGSVPN